MSRIQQACLAVLCLCAATMPELANAQAQPQGLAPRQQAPVGIALGAPAAMLSAAVAKPASAAAGSAPSTVPTSFATPTSRVATGAGVPITFSSDKPAIAYPASALGQLKPASANASAATPSAPGTEFAPQPGTCARSCRRSPAPSPGAS